MPTNAEILTRQVGTLIRNRYHDNPQEAFNAYAGRGGEVSRAGVERLLRDASVGNFITRDGWVDGVMDAFDRQPKNGSISWSEFQAGLNSAPR